MNSASGSRIATAEAEYDPLDRNAAHLLGRQHSRLADERDAAPQHEHRRGECEDQRQYNEVAHFRPACANDAEEEPDEREEPDDWTRTWASDRSHRAEPEGARAPAGQLGDKPQRARPVH